MPSMRFVSRSDIRQRFEGKRVAVVGSGPGALGNEPGLVDGFDVVVRVNNYKLSAAAGFRCDVHYSFYGTSIRKARDELKHDGVTLCMVKIPNAHAIESAWHRRRGQMIGVDFRPHFERRKDWWFTDTYVPTVDEFMVSFNVLGKRIPTTGFAAIFDVLSFDPKSLFLTGFDFFTSGIHNVNEPWRRKNADGLDPDPFRHAPERERAWLAGFMIGSPIKVDAALALAMSKDMPA